MTTTHDDRWKLPDGLEWLDVSQGACRYYVSNDAGDILVLGASGESYGSLKDRPDAAHLEALLRARNGYVLPPGFEWRRDESVPPPGVTLQRCTPHGNPGVQIHYDDGLGLVAGVQCHLGDIVAEEDVPEVLRLLWRKYEREHGYAPPAAEVKAETVTFAVGDRVTVLVDTPVPGISIIIPQGAIGTVTEVFDDRRIEVDWGREYGPRWWMDVSTLSPAPERDWDAELREASPVNDRAPTYDEVIAAARAAKREIEAEWPAWKKAIR